MPKIIEITDFNDSALDVYARLTENQLINRHEPEKGLFIAESPKVIERALDTGYIPVSMLLEKKHVETQAKEIIARCGEITEKLAENSLEEFHQFTGEFPNESAKPFPVYTAEFDVLAQLTGFQLTRGVLCAMRRPKQPSVEEILSAARRVAVLENVMNPTNLGAIFRSAAALGMDAVLLSTEGSDPLYRRATRVSMGTVFQVPWAYFPEDAPWPEGGMTLLKKYGFQTVALALKEDSIHIDDERLLQAEKLAVVLGTEGDGLADSTIAGCDYTAIIPMSHGVDSLNVAAASAVAFYQLGK